MSKSFADDLKKSSGFDSLEQEAFLSIVRTADVLMRGFSEVVKPAGLSPTQYNVLRSLRGAGPGGLACQEIGQRMISRDPDLTRLLDRLEARGWIVRQRDSADRRVVQTRITPPALDLLARLDEPVRTLHVEQLKHVGPSSLRQLCDLLEAARRGVNATTCEGKSS
jgi:DNA-binding MarR family transcriptional regulator